jgi:aryl-alcohol dehydrogenase-like predicted oxidoreductase
MRRLGLDYIDRYQIPRWDPETPIEETMEPLHDLVKSGKVRYLGASSMFASQFSKAQYTADLHGWTPFVSSGVSTTCYSAKKSGIWIDYLHIDA